MAEIYYEPSGCSCGGKIDYTKEDINNAATEALSLASQGKTLGKDKYPHVYNDYEKFTFSHARKPYLEFPVFSGSTYSGGSPGADRVVIGSIAEDYSSAVYCAVITHDGQSDDAFVECTDDTMNVNGKAGKFTGHTKKSHRKLLDRIDLK